MKNAYHKIAAGLAVLPTFLLPATTFGQGLTDAQKDLDNIKGTLQAGGGAATASLPVLIGNLINVVLGVMGILFVILIVYAGILYLQGGMDKEKISKAKSLIVNAIVGLVIVVAAYAISSFIIQQVISVAR